jgi:hypothetical protein
MKTSTGGNRGNGERFFYKNSVVSVNSCEKGHASAEMKTSTEGNRENRDGFL